jgi:hypothetical protein
VKPGGGGIVSGMPGYSPLPRKTASFVKNALNGRQQRAYNVLKPEKYSCSTAIVPTFWLSERIRTHKLFRIGGVADD